MIEHCVPFIAIDNILLQIMFRYSEASLPENYVVHFTHYTQDSYSSILLLGQTLLYVY